jgi:signal transduction histidine kinase
MIPENLHEVRERYSELSTVVRLSLELGMELNVDKVLEKIVQQISDDLGFQIVSILLLDEEGAYLTIKASRGLDSEIVESTRIKVGEGVAGWVAQKGESLLVSDIEGDPRFRKIRSHGRYFSRSLICVPLLVGNRVIGVLNGNNRKRSGELSDHDLRLLSVYAAQASVIIERARLYRNLEIQADELSAAYNQLQALDKTKSDFITNVSHEFRTPVTVILGYLELLKGGLDDPDHVEKVKISMDAAYRLAKLVDDSTDILRLDSGTMPFTFRRTNMGDFLMEMVHKHRANSDSKGVTLSLNVQEGLPEVSIDIVKIRKVFDKLVDNSLKFTPRDGYVKISCSIREEGFLTVAVEDSGPGIPFGDRERAFQRFEQGGDIMTSKPEGTGLGLPIARAIVVRHGGRIWLDQHFTEGSRILFSLPIVGLSDDGDDQILG